MGKGLKGLKGPKAHKAAKVNREVGPSDEGELLTPQSGSRFLLGGYLLLVCGGKPEDFHPLGMSEIFLTGMSIGYSEFPPVGD